MSCGSVEANRRNPLRRDEQSGKWSYAFTAGLRARKNTPALATIFLLDQQLQWMLEHGGLDFADFLPQTEQSIPKLTDRLRDASNSSDSVYAPLAKEWRTYRTMALPPELNPPEPSSSGATKPVYPATDEYCDLLLKKTNEAPTREAESSYQKAVKLRRSQEAYAFVHFHNRLFESLHSILVVA
jgi:hypothetical protein